MSAQESVFGIHLYQPPRQPFHQELLDRSTDPQGIDWTERIYQECYRRLVDENILSLASFDILGNLRHDIQRLSRRRSREINHALREHGAGEPYLHPILPDLSREDKEILIGAGYEDFRRTAGVTPLVFWPPETALDAETLSVLSEYYPAFICSPKQIRRQDGRDADNLPTMINVGRRSIIALPFDRVVSNRLAFGDKRNADRFRDDYVLPRLRPLGNHQPLLAWTDAETFGHHFPDAELFLKYLLLNSLPDKGVIPVPVNELVRTAYKPGEGRLMDRTAWSCDHGDLRRWHDPCPCGTGDLTWKGPFYSGLHTLNGYISDLIREKLGPGFKDKLIADFPAYLENPGGRGSKTEKSLLSAKAAALAGVTSCGTFFDNPGTSARINAVFALQALYHLADAGLVNEAESGRQILRRLWLMKKDHFPIQDATFGEILR
jgi:hypothetical protein